MERKRTTQVVDYCIDEQDQNLRASFLPPGVANAGRVSSHGLVGPLD